MRIRENNVSGHLDADMLIGSDVMSSPELASLPEVVAPNVAVAFLKKPDGSFEIVHVISHVALEGTATVLRAQEGTVESDWLSGSAWKHGPTATDHDMAQLADDLDADVAALLGAPDSLTRTSGNAAYVGRELVDTGRLSEDALSATFARVFTPEAYGAEGDGTADDTAAVQAALDAATAAEGGTVYLHPGRTYRCDGQLTHGGGYLRITSAGGSTRDFNDGTDSTTGPILDLRYAGADAKFLCLQKGVIEIDHITVADFGASSTPFLLITLTQPRIHDAYFHGNPTKYRGTCDQDAIVLGGTSNAGQSAGNPASGFAGYGGYVKSNDFHRIRRAVHARNFVNNILFDANATDVTCGSNLAVDAPFVFDSGSTSTADLSNHCQGNIITNNTIELLDSYAHGIMLKNNCRRNVIKGNGFWDKIAGKYVSDVHIDEATGCWENGLWMEGYSNSDLVTGVVPLDGLNFVWSWTELWAGVKTERKPAGYKMFLYGTDVYHYLDLNLPRSAVRIAAWYGLEVRSSQTATSFVMRSCHGDPNGAVTGVPGDICMNVDGGAGQTMWVKETGTGNTGWVAK